MEELMKEKRPHIAEFIDLPECQAGRNKFLNVFFECTAGYSCLGS
jgi:hypothetical protein